jgi:uncharacterized protein (TIGR03067 family)
MGLEQPWPQRQTGSGRRWPHHFEEQPMRYAICLGAAYLLVSVYSTRADEPAKNGKFDPAKMAGTWSYVSAEKDGVKSDPTSLKDKVTITKESITLGEGENKFVFKFAIDGKKDPVRISLEGTEGLGKGSKAEGIIELTGDQLKLCYAPSGDAPKKFESKEGSGHRLVILKRAK